jgi:hypothetical protein
MKKIIILAALIGLSGCSKTQVMSGEFRTMDSCLTKIQENSGYELDIVTDEFGNISGFLKGTKLGFECKTESTGTKGVVVKGWYQVKS